MDFAMVSTSVLALVVICLLVITLGIQVQVRSLTGKIDKLLKQTEK